jgi:hypothetical protein
LWNLARKLKASGLEKMTCSKFGKDINKV